MPQLDFSAFFLQFLTISLLLFWLTWFFVNNILEIIYMIIICRNIIISYFSNFKIKYYYLLNKIFYFKLSIFNFFQIEFRYVIINFYKLIKFNSFKIINFLDKILNIYKYFLKFRFFLNSVHMKLVDNFIISVSLINYNKLNV